MPATEHHPLCSGAARDGKIADNDPPRAHRTFRLRTIYASDAIDALNGADTYELLSLDPGNHEAPPANQFHTWQVLGKVLIDDAATRARLNDALRAGASEKVDPAACFEPRHGIRVTHAGQTTDFVICFGCGQAYVLTTAKKGEEFLVSHSPRAVFDEVLKSKSVPLPTD